MRGNSEDDQNTINYLQKELNTMNQALERNNVEFEEEIKVNLTPRRNTIISCTK